MHRLVLTLLMALAVVLAPSAMASSAAKAAPIEQAGHCPGNEPAPEDAAPVQGVHCALCGAVAPRIAAAAPTVAAPVAVQRPPMLAALDSLSVAIEPPPPRIFPHA